MGTIFSARHNLSWTFLSPPVLHKATIEPTLLTKYSIRIYGASIMHITFKQIEKELAALENGEPRPWLAQSDLLDSIESSGYWHHDSDSFTSWLAKNAIRFGVKPPMLWRRLTAGRFVRQIKANLELTGVELPDLEEISNNVGPESVELFSKLKRVLPEDTFSDLARKVFSGKVRRAELKSLWATYRPVLGGKTARGRGVPPPRINRTDPDQYNSLMEAMALDSLKAAGPGWSGHLNPKLYQIFLHVTPDDHKVPRGCHLFSAIAVIMLMNGDIEYHGFRYRSFSMAGKSSTECPEAAYCDFLWYIVPPKRFDDTMKFKMLKTLPDFAGLVLLNDGSVNILKQALSAPCLGVLRNKLVSVLFYRSLGAK